MHLPETVLKCEFLSSFSSPASCAWFWIESVYSGVCDGRREEESLRGAAAGEM